MDYFKDEIVVGSVLGNFALERVVFCGASRSSYSSIEET
jgi:hypothetical protein